MLIDDDDNIRTTAAPGRGVMFGGGRSYGNEDYMESVTIPLEAGSTGTAHTKEGPHRAQKTQRRDTCSFAALRDAKPTWCGYPAGPLRGPNRRSIRLVRSQ